MGLDYLASIERFPVVQPDPVAEVDSSLGQVSKARRLFNGLKKVVTTTINVLYTGFKSPLGAVGYNSIAFAVTQYKDQTSDRHNEYGRLSQNSIIVGQGCPAVKVINSTASKLSPKLYATVRCGEGNSPELVSTNSHSLFSAQSITLNPIFFHDRETVRENVLLLRSQPNGREVYALTLSLTERESYLKFLGTHCLSIIKSNANLIVKGTELAALYLAKYCADYAAQKAEMDPNSWTYAIVTGLFAKTVSQLAAALVNREFVFKADREAVRATNDLRSAVECLRIIDTSNSRTFTPFALGQPSLKERIRRLDPKGLIKPGTELDHFSTETTPLTDAEREQFLKIFGQLPDVKLLKELKANKEELSRLIQHGLKQAAKFGMSAYAVRQSPLLILILSMIYLTFPVTCKQLEHRGPLSREQQTVNSACQEMGVESIPVGIDDESGPVNYCALGTGMGPEKMVVGSTNSPLSDKEDFIWRHEVRHIFGNHNLMVALAEIVTIFGMDAVMSALGILPDNALQALVQGSVQLVTANAVKNYVSRKIETIADREAVLFSRPENRTELIRQGKAFLDAVVQHNLSLRNDPSVPLISRIVRKIVISSDGENRLDVAHPALAKRKKDLEALEGRDS